MDKIIDLIEDYVRKAWYRGTEDIIGADRVASDFADRMRQMPPEQRDAYVKSFMDRGGIGLRVDPTEYFSQTAMSEVPEMIINPDQIYADGEIIRTDVLPHEFGHDTDAKMRRRGRKWAYEVPISIEDNLGEAIGKDLDEGRGLPIKLPKRLSGILADDLAVEGMYYDQLALDPKIRGLRSITSRLAPVHPWGYSSSEEDWAKRSDPENRYSSKDAQKRAAQSMEGFAELGALGADRKRLREQYNTTPEELYPEGSKRFREILLSDPRREGIEYRSPDKVLERRRSSLKAIPYTSNKPTE